LSSIGRLALDPNAICELLRQLAGPASIAGRHRDFESRASPGNQRRVRVVVTQQGFPHTVFVDACLPELAQIGDLLEGQLVPVALSLRACNHAAVLSEDLAGE